MPGKTCEHLCICVESIYLHVLRACVYVYRHWCMCEKQRLYICFVPSEGFDTSSCLGRLVITCVYVLRELVTCRTFVYMCVESIGLCVKNSVDISIYSSQSGVSRLRHAWEGR